MGQRMLSQSLGHFNEVCMAVVLCGTYRSWRNTRVLVVFWFISKWLFLLSRMLPCLNMDSGDNGHRCIHEAFRSGGKQKFLHIVVFPGTNTVVSARTRRRFRLARGGGISEVSLGLCFFSSDVMVTHRPFSNEQRALRQPPLASGHLWTKVSKPSIYDGGTGVIFVLWFS